MTKRVPGVTGRNQPLGRNTSMMSAKVTPLSQRSMPVDCIEAEDVVETAAVDKGATGIEAGIAVTAAQTKREKRGGGCGPENVGNLVIPSRLEDVGVSGRGVAPP